MVYNVLLKLAVAVVLLGAGLWNLSWIVYDFLEFIAWLLN